MIGYMRASKVDGSEALDLQRESLLAAGVEPANIYEDMAPAHENRPGLAKCLKSLREDDILVIWKLDRLGRSLKHLIETVEDLSKRGVGFRVLHGAPVDTATIVALAEFKRDLIHERELAGLIASRARGRQGGRKSSLTPEVILRAQAAMQSRDTNVTHLCEELGTSRNVLYRHVTPEGELTEVGKRALLAKRSDVSETRKSREDAA